MCPTENAMGPPATLRGATGPPIGPHAGVTGGTLSAAGQIRREEHDPAALPAPAAACDADTAEAARQQGGAVRGRVHPRTHDGSCQPAAPTEHRDRLADRPRMDVV